MDGGHESFFNSESVIDYLGQWGEAIGGTRSVGDDVLVWLVAQVINSNNVGRGVVLGWCG